MNPPKIKLLIVDDHPVLREGIKTVLELTKQFEVVSQTDDGSQAPELISLTNPDIVLMDIRMDKMDGISAARQVKKHHPETRILLLTMYDDEEYIREALEIGVEGYILKMSDMKDVVKAIKAVYEDETFYDPKITKSVAEKAHSGSIRTNYEETLKQYDLTKREIEIATYIVNGYSYQQIAEILFISPYTVYNHKKNIFTKLNIKKTNELIRIAINSGLFIK